MRKYIPYIILFIVFVVAMIILFYPQNITSDKILFYKKNYNINSYVSDDDYFTIDIMVNNKKSYFVDKTQIIYSYLSNQEVSSIIDLEIVDIIETSDEIVYDKTKYYRYSFVFKILFKSLSFVEWYFEDAKLIMSYNGQKNYDLSIGNFSLIKLEDSNNLITISSVKPILSKVNNNDYLTAVVFGIRSTNNETLHLKQIRILNEDITVGSNITRVNDNPEGNDFKEIFGYDYKNQLNGDGFVQYSINNEIKYYIVPIYYEQLIIANNFPIEFTFTKNDETYKYYFYGFRYFDVTNEVIDKNNIFIYDVI